jgi:hypothetical protein
MTMKIKLIYFVVLGLALALTISVCDGLRYKEKTSVLIGNLEQVLIQERLNAAEQDKIIAAKNIVIAEQDKKLITSAQVIGHMTKAIGQKDAELDKIRGTWSILSAECQFKLHELDDTWGGKYRLLEGVVVEKDKQITAWAGKYDAQVVISDAWKAKFEGAQRLLTISASVNKSLIRKVKTQAIIGNIKTGAVVAAAGYIIFNAIKGK